ncbi:MAG: deoxyribodipyrimidine photo-lyase [Bacteroidota bacterium]
MQHPPILVWLRRDLRLHDNPALFHAAATGRPIVPVFIWSPEEAGAWAPGGAHKWWFHHSLLSFRESLAACGASLVIRSGSSERELNAILATTGADAVYWNTRYEPEGKAIDAAILATLKARGISVTPFASHLLHQPDLIKTGSGLPYKVFTPFWKKIHATMEVPAQLPAPASLVASTSQPDSVPIEALDLLPQRNWADGFPSLWTPGEQAARERLTYFCDHLMVAYPKQRDIPEDDGTSQLSPYLHFGEISPRQIWQAVSEKMHDPALQEAGVCYLREIAWREFSYHLIHHFPQTAQENLRPAFDHFPWNTNADWLKRWQTGTTGYPIVDAGMRQLWHTGWMHNRVRIVVASFLTKHLRMHWQHGARWFWDTLVDGNLANNTMGWQWSAGSGADAQPFFRIFNPIAQSERFDAKGTYIKRWVPELGKLPAKYVHTPWTLPRPMQEHLGFYPGKAYPLPVVDHKTAREAALAAYQTIRK